VQGQHLDNRGESQHISSLSFSFFLLLQVFKPTLPVAHVRNQLAFESTEDCLDFLNEKLGAASISGEPGAQVIDTALGRTGAAQQRAEVSKLKGKAAWAVDGDVAEAAVAQKRLRDPFSTTKAAAGKSCVKKMKMKKEKEEKKQKKKKKKKKASTSSDSDSS